MDPVLKRVYDGTRPYLHNVPAQDWNGSFLLHLQRSSSRDLKSAMSPILAQHIRFLTREFDLPDEDSPEILEKASALKDRGYTHFRLDPDQVTGIKQNLAGIGMVGSGGRDRITLGHEISNASAPAYAYDTGNILQFPQVVRAVEQSKVVRVARAYLEALPQISGFSVSLNIAGRAGALPSGDWHYDKGSIAFLKMFIYLNDVSAQNGPHGFVAGSHDDQKVREALVRKYGEGNPAIDALWTRQRWGDAEVDAVFPDEQVFHAGPDGLIILEDTRGFHRATVPAEGYRLMMTISLTLDGNMVAAHVPRFALDAVPSVLRPQSAVSEKRFRYLFSQYLQ